MEEIGQKKEGAEGESGHFYRPTNSEKKETKGNAEAEAAAAAAAAHVFCLITW
jgi:hypothetical protein